MSALAPSPLDKFISRTRLSWFGFVTVIGVALLGLPIAVVFLDGFMDEFLHEGVWRQMYVAPAIIIYILALHTPIQRYQIRAIEAFRQLVRIDDDAFGRLVNEISDVDDRAELVAFLVGAVFGFLGNPPWNIVGDYFWLKIYIPLTSALMLGLMAWIVVTSLGGTKLQAALHKQPLEIDLFDIRPFEPIGRYSLVVALAFVGGSALSVVILNPLEQGLDVFTLGLYVVLAVVTLLVFFLGMRHTHRVLADLKREKLWEVRHSISEVFNVLEACRSEGGDISELNTELNLWLKYEERVKAARTWPYNTPMLRALFLSVLLPAAVSIGQRVVTSMFSR